MLSAPHSGGHIDDLPDSSIAVSFISNLPDERFITPPGLDLSAGAGTWQCHFAGVGTGLFAHQTDEPVCHASQPEEHALAPVRSGHTVVNTLI